MTSSPARLLRVACCAAIGAGLIGGLPPRAILAQPPPTGAEAALGSIFSPRRAPAAKTMGLVQRSFLDLAEVSRARLQVALVIDGTESMGEEIEGIRRAARQMVEDLRRYRDVEFQLVVFRDEGAASGSVGFPLDTPRRGFTRDLPALDNALGQLRAESGAPYFPELVDLGIQRALTELDWSSDASTQRWLMIFGDAPPFDEGFDEPAASARRQVATAQLIDTAKRRGVQLNCILCTSRPADREIYEWALPRTREFMNRLAADTGGLMLDLSYPDIRQALAQAAAVERVGYGTIGRITRQEIDRARQQSIERQDLLASDRRLRIAVLPHLPLDQLSFEPSRDAVQVAVELRHRLRALPGAELKSPLAIERQAAILAARGIRGDQLLPALASALDVDYVVWGTVSAQLGELEIRSAIYDKVQGKEIGDGYVRASAQLPVPEMTARLVTELGEQVQNRGIDVRLAAAFGSVPAGSASQLRLVSSLARTAAGRSRLLAGFARLEKALAHTAGSAEADALLLEAGRELQAAREEDPQNPLVYLLLANCCFNQAAAWGGRGEREQAAAASQDCAQALALAYRFRQEAGFAYLRREIEGDHALLLRKDLPEAIAAYEDLARVSADTPLHAVLRAHWMLAGIYSGDWGVAQHPQGEALVDAAKAREHLLQILAHWSDSSEAEFIRRNLRWDEETGENRFEHFPRVHETAAAKVGG